ncbi:hypothetical protein Aca07nite_17520 [Actinoplanes capillaceus]|uniref:Uncharacterized protein n=1 Tax=Actinoplanes campanulatus TaxID=113559 RepID=A0ABQ3WEK9_9ACTN|nr:hypothetical protein Aca07nite_17520 [Actinoplanes capillaceus]
MGGSFSPDPAHRVGWGIPAAGVSSPGCGSAISPISSTLGTRSSSPRLGTLCQWDGEAGSGQRTPMADNEGDVRDAPESYGYPDLASSGLAGRMSARIHVRVQTEEVAAP